MRIEADNFLSMARAVNERGKTLVIPSHNPHYKEYGNRILPDDHGLAAVIVANLTSKVILPVAVEFHTDKKVGMTEDIIDTVKTKLSGIAPESTVHIAEPVFLDKGKIPDEIVTSQADVLEALQLFRSQTRQTLTPQQRANASLTLNKLKAQAEIVVMAQAAELPVEARGKWDEELRKSPPATIRE